MKERNRETDFSIETGVLRELHVVQQSWRRGLKEVLEQ